MEEKKAFDALGEKSPSRHPLASCCPPWSTGFRHLPLTTGVRHPRLLTRPDARERSRCFRRDRALSRPRGQVESHFASVVTPECGQSLQSASLPRLVCKMVHAFVLCPCAVGYLAVGEGNASDRNASQS